MERVFNIFDQDGSGEISLAEFLDTMYKFAGKDPTNKLLFLFKVYDIDGRYYGIMRRRMEFTSKMYINYHQNFVRLFEVIMLLLIIGDGLIQQEELECVLRACLQVSKMLSCPVACIFYVYLCF